MLTNPQGSSIGAGVHNASTQANLRVNPGGLGCTFTNNRAELCAILAALDTSPHTTDLTIYTDSLGSLQNIQKMINWPSRLQESKHREVLHHIVQLLGTRAMLGSHTYLYKVRSHSGIAGNDQADRLAKEAAQTPNAANYTTHLGEQAYEGMYWPQIHIPATDTNQLAPNLTQGIKTHLPPCTQRGPTRKAGVYTNLWDAQLPTLDRSASSQYWTNPAIKGSLKLQLMRARWGNLWNKKRAYRCRMSYAGSELPATSDMCPICNLAQDGASHIFAGCRHKDFVASYIKRHDGAVKLIQRSVAKGKLGGSYMIMDAGKEADLPTSVRRKTLPPELRPPSVPEETWGKMRPDILILPGLRAKDNPQPLDKYEIILVEVGYCSDTNHNIKIRAKQQQHADLIAALRSAGHTVRPHTITLGTTGTIHQDLQTTLTAMQVDSSSLKRVANKLHLHAALCAGNILAMRRHLEWQERDPG